MHGDSGARRRNAAASAHDAFVARKVGRGGTATAVAQRLAVSGAPVSRDRAMALPLPGYDGPVSRCWRHHGTSGISAARVLGIAAA